MAEATMTTAGVESGDDGDVTETNAARDPAPDSGQGAAKSADNRAEETGPHAHLKPEATIDLTHRTAAVHVKNWRQEFLEKLSEQPNVTRACRLAGVSRGYVYELRESDDVFRKQWETALEMSVGNLKESAWAHGVEGVLKPVFGKLPGQHAGVGIVGWTREIQPNIMITLLKAYGGEEFRERSEVRHVGDGMSLDDRILAAAAAIEEFARKRQAELHTGNGQVMEAEIVEDENDESND